MKFFIYSLIIFPLLTSAQEVQIGDLVNGGIVFYIDESGESGLVAATEDVSSYIWGCNKETLEGADGRTIGTGGSNTLDIVAGCKDSNTAAQVALNYESEGYNDWYLPSQDELNKMYQNIGQGNALGLGNVGGFADISYWSSTEYTSNLAWQLSFGFGSQSYNSKTGQNNVRAVRAF